MREAIREVRLQKEKADKVVDKEADEQKEIREGVKNLRNASEPRIGGWVKFRERSGP